MKPMLAKKYEGQNPRGWLMSEKLDGCRAIWDGHRLMSRNDKPFAAPAWFTNQLPAGVVLDGELFSGRRMFQKTVGIVRKKNPIDSEWEEIKYLVFDAPKASGGFESRIEFVSKILSNCAVARVIPQTVCEGKSHLEKMFLGLINHGAEGVMLRCPGSGYEESRSENLLKYKPFETDEAEIIGYQDGEGKHSGRLGALVCRWKNVLVNLGTGLSDSLRDSPPKIGAHVTFSFQGLTDGGVPRFPVFLTERSYE